MTVVFFRSQANTRKGSLEVTFFRMSVRMYVRRFFEIQLSYGTPHMTINGAQVNRKCNVRDLQVQDACALRFFKKIKGSLLCCGKNKTVDVSAYCIQIKKNFKRV